MATYKATYQLSNGKQIEAVASHLPDLGSVVRVPGTESYGEVISIEETVEAGETCSDPHCAACDAGVKHTQTRFLHKKSYRSFRSY